MRSKLCTICGFKISKNSEKYCWSCYREILKERNSKTGKDHFNWKGGTHINKWGYLRYNPCKDKSISGRFVHVVALEKKLGRKLKPNERTHHINGDRLDNRPENLEAMTIAEHNAIHKPWLKRKPIRDPKTGRYIG